MALWGFIKHGGRGSSGSVGGYWVGRLWWKWLYVLNHFIKISLSTFRATVLRSLKWTSTGEKIKIDGQIPAQRTRQRLLSVRQYTPHARREMFFDIFWKTIDPHRISQSFLGVWEGSLENVLTTAITGLKDCGRDVWNLALERRLFLHFLFVSSEPSYFSRCP